MARMREKSLLGAQKAPYSGEIPGVSISGRVHNTTNSAGLTQQWSKANTFEERWRNAAGTDDVRALSVNGYDQVMVAEALATAERKEAKWYIQDNGSIASQGFFLVNTGESYRITGITYIHTTQSSVGGTIYVEKTPSGTAIGSGTSLMSGTFDCTAANATLQTATLSTTKTGDSDNPDLILAAGDMLSVVVAGTITSLAGVLVTVTMAPLGKSVKTVSYYVNANADIAQAQMILTANRPYNVTAVSIRYSTLSSVSGLKLTVTNDTKTTAAGGGTSVLTDNTNAGVLVTQTANTTYSGTVSSTAATVLVVPDSYLSIKFSSGTVTALVGVVVTVSLQETSAGRIEKTFCLNHIPGASDLTGWVSGYFWTADRDYEVLDISETHDVATGAAAKVTVTAETGTTAAGSGTVLNTANTNAGFDLAATARTPQHATLPTLLGSRIIVGGTRLSVKPSGTLTSGKGVNITVSLAPR